MLSVGKFDRGLYLNKKRFEASIIGGLVTVLCTLIIVTYSVFVFESIVSREEYRMD